MSQFSKVLSMFGEHLKNIGIQFVTLTGETKIDTRNDIVTRFNSSSSSVQVNLCSCFNVIASETYSVIITRLCYYHSLLVELVSIWLVQIIYSLSTRIGIRSWKVKLKIEFIVWDKRNQ